MSLNGTLYIGYPVIASADETVTVDALLVCREHGLVVFSFRDLAPPTGDAVAWDHIRDEQDRLYFVLETNLSRHPGLRAGRRLGIDVEPITIFPNEPQPPETLEGTYSDVDGLPRIISDLPAAANGFFRPLQAALQRVTTIKPAKRRAKVTRGKSRGSVMKSIEQEIANLDKWQKQAAIESPDGPQRIRGLAGSGKTVVLALKAAYLHAHNPDWDIAVTFHTRSLYQQFEDLIRRFSFERLNDEPDWKKLRILHAWGGRERGGLYADMAEYSGLTPRDFLYGRERYGMQSAFRGVCSELLSATATSAPEPLYDAVLVDEAQDLPGEFFQLVYRFTRPPKRVIWAYDELQQLSEASMPGVDELFGKDEEGSPRVHLANVDDQPQQDIILPVCYRNTPWALTLAHALGFGVYRQEGLVQHFDDPSLWTDIGYRVRDGQLSVGDRVILERDRGTYPQYFENLLDPQDAIVSRRFDDEVEQADWVARSIKFNLEVDELDPDDILIVLPNAYTARQKFTVVTEALIRLGVNSHLAGVTSSRDEIFSQKSVAIANIHRSKGNEAPMVYVLDCQYCVAGHELITLRNILFTAITRSRAWVRLCGWGPDMDRLEAEIQAARAHNFRLDFTVPTVEELAKLRKIHRERTTDERARIQKAEKGLQYFLDTLERGDLSLDNLPLELRGALLKHLEKEDESQDETV